MTYISNVEHFNEQNLCFSNESYSLLDQKDDLKRSIHKYEFDKYGSLIKIKYYAFDDKPEYLKMSTEYQNQYDSKGNLISYEAIITECFAFRDEKKIQTGTYSYDDKNNNIGFAIVRIDSNGDELLNIKSESTYDEKGYIARKKEYIKERDHAIRKISFHNRKQSHDFFYDSKGSKIEEIRIYNTNSDGHKLSLFEATTKTELVTITNDLKNGVVHKNFIKKNEDNDIISSIHLTNEQEVFMYNYDIDYY